MLSNLTNRPPVTRAVMAFQGSTVRLLPMVHQALPPVTLRVTLNTPKSARRPYHRRRQILGHRSYKLKRTHRQGLMEVSKAGWWRATLLVTRKWRFPAWTLKGGRRA